jgi:8-oxo-dGTP pyrophosphatase MutT (NUDIX family)
MTGDRDGFAERLRAILASRQRQTLVRQDLVCAAVLIPLLFKRGVWHVAVTQRTHDVEHHKGQISFPGGACEPRDANLVVTALRETHEEIGVPPAAVEILGALDDFPTITDFVVTPFVGIIPHPFDYDPNPAEVERVVEVPIPFLCEPDHVRTEQRVHDGQVFDVLFWDYGPHVIWGATARMLKGLLDLVC